MYCYDCMNEIKGNGNYCVHCGKTVHEDDFPHHLKPGTILRNQYLVGNSIGEGGFGITYIGLDLSLDIKIAIKEFYPSGFANRNNTVSNKVTLNYRNEGEYFKNGREHFLQEAKSIAKFHKETSIVDVMAFFEENDTAYIIMEYLDGLNLSERVSEYGKFDAVELFKLFIPMMKSLDKMHKVEIIHRDISPENIRILSDGTLKLMDFGSARYFAGMDKKTMSVQFKPGYAPFEQYNKNGNQGPWTDVYGLCATIYKCITGVTPVDSLERYQNDSLKKPSELGVIIPTSLEQILMYGLAIYPDNRCQSMAELITIVEAALKNEKIVLKNQSNTANIDDIYKTRAADEQYKTAFADNNSVIDDNKTVYADDTADSQDSKNSFDENKVKERNFKSKNKILGISLIAGIIVFVFLTVLAVSLRSSYVNNEKDAVSNKKLSSTIEGDGWSFNPQTDTLTISISGDMDDYDYSEKLNAVNTPWHNYSENIKNIVVQDGVASIGESAFEGCSNLKNIDIADSVTSISSRAFYNCNSLETVSIPNSVTSIGEMTFDSCTSLKSINISDNVTSISMYEFDDCTSLTSINVSKNNSKFSSINGNLYNKEKTKLIKYAMGKQNTKFIIPNGVKKIGDLALQSCKKLKTVIIPNGVKTIGFGAFNICTNLAYIEIPNSVNKIDDSAFSFCEKLEYLNLPDNVTNIGNRLCEGCSNLTFISIGNNVKSIGSQAFLDCTSLTSIEIPDSVLSIDEAFHGCDSLESVTIPDSVTSIDDEAFYGIAYNITIYCNRGSFAESYAKNKSIDYEYID